MSQIEKNLYHLYCDQLIKIIIFVLSHKDKECRFSKANTLSKSD